MRWLGNWADAAIANAIRILDCIVDTGWIRGQGVNGKGEQAEGNEVRWGEVGPKKRQHVAVGQMDNLFTRRLVGSKMAALDSDSDDDNDNDNGGDS